MISGKDNLLEWFKMQGKPVFSVFRKNKEESGNFVYTNKDRENETMETATAYLDRCLSLLNSGDFFIYCHGLTPSSKGRSEMYFTINYSHIPTVLPHNNMPAVSGFDEQTMMQKATAMAQDMFTRLINEKELKDTKAKLAELTKENKELAAQVAAPMRQFIGEVMPYIGGIAEHLGLSKALAPALPVSGVAPDNHIEDNHSEALEGTADEERMNAVVNAFAQALAAQYPGTWLDIIEKLTNTLHNSPDKIKMALNFL